MKTIREALVNLLSACRPRPSRWLKPALAVALGLAAVAAKAQPANDLFANAFVISGDSGSTNGNNTNATLEACETNAVNTPMYADDTLTNSVWFKWTAPVSGTIEMDTDGSNPDNDYILSIWTTPSNLCDPGLTNIISEDDNQVDSLFNDYSQAIFPVTAGTTYYISVNSYDDGTPGDNVGAYVLNWNAEVVPPNDDFSNATVLVGNSGTTNGSNVGATLEPCEPTTVNTSLYPNDPLTNSVWYLWTAPTNGTVEVDTAGSTSGDEFILSVWTTSSGLCDPSLTNIVADDDGQGTYSEVSFPVTAGTTYYISVAAYDDGTPGDNEGPFDLNWNGSFPNLPSGPISFTRNTYVVSTSDSDSPLVGDGTTVSSSLLGARLTLTRPAPAYGRVLVDYAVNTSDANSTYLNTFVTNYYGTNIVTEMQATNAMGNWSPPASITYSNFYSTNVVVTNYYQVYDANAGGLQTVVKTYSYTNSAYQYYMVALQLSTTNSWEPSLVPTNPPFLGIFPFTNNYTTSTNFVQAGFLENLATNVYGYILDGLLMKGTNSGDGATVTNGLTVYTDERVVYTNTPVTNFFGLNITQTYTSNNVFSGPLFSTNFLLTYAISGDIYSSNSIYTNATGGTIRQDVTGIIWYTNAVATNLVETIMNATNFINQVGRLTQVFPPYTNVVPFANLSYPTITSYDSSSNLITSTTNVYGYSTTNYQVISSVTGITPVSGTAVFENLQMSTDILIPLAPAAGPDADYSYIPARADVVLSNARLDTNEDSTIVEAPTVSTPAAILNAISPYFEGVNDGEAPNPLPLGGPGLFSWERSTFRVQKNVNGGVATVSVECIGGNLGDAATVQYIIDPDWPNYNSIGDYPNPDDPPLQLYDPANTFVLQAGSDYATPNSDYTPITGTLTFPVGNHNPQTISIPILNNGAVEQNVDMLLQLYDPLPEPTTTDPGFLLSEVNQATLTILFDDTTVIGGAFPGQQPAGAVDRSWNKDGASDSTPPYLNYPGTTPGLDGTVYAVAEQPDGNAIIAGSFISFDSTLYNRIVRVLPNGYQDPTFQGNSSSLGNNSGANDFIAAVTLQPDGGIIIGGNFTAFNGYNRHYVARLLSNGAVDTSFNPGQGANGRVWSIALQPNGQIVIGGEFTSYNGTNVNEVARLNADGSLDTTFNPGAGPDGIVDAVAVDSIGNVVIGGDFAHVAGVESGGVARLTPTGSLDTTFAPGIGTLNPNTFVTDTVKSVAIQPNGAIIIGGSFSYYDLVNYNGLARLNTDGTVDLTFQSGTGTLNPVTGDADTVDTVVLDPSGNILIGGNFTTYNQTRRYGLARVFTDGSLDTSFMDATYNQFAGVPNDYYNANYISPTYPYYNTRNAIYSIALESNPQTTGSNIVIGGTFEMVGGGNTRDDVHPRSNVARVIGGSTPGPGNIELMYNNYSVNNSDGSLYVSLIRTNGFLGPISAAFNVTTAAAGPGIATAGTDFAPSAFDPTWVTTYSINDRSIETVEPGEWGPNFNETPKFNPNNPAAGVTIDVFNPGNITGNLSANFGLSAPSSSFTLGGEYLPVGAALGAQQNAPLTIIDSNVKSGTVGFSSPTYTVIENGGSATITLVRTNGSTGPITLFYATTDGSATNGIDYTGVTNTVTIPSGNTNATFTIATKGHYTSVQPDKTVNLRIFTPSAGTLGLTNAVLTLINPNYAPGHISFSTANYSVNENAGPALITVNRLGGSATTLGVTFTITNGTAFAGTNFVAITTNLFWVSGDATSRIIAVPVIDDGVPTANLIANLRLINSQVNNTNNPEPLAFGGTNATLTIVNEDSGGTIQFSLPTYSVKKYAGYALIPVTRTGGSIGTVMATLTTLNDTALAGVDYTGITNTLTFTNGQLSQLVEVPVLPTTNGLRDLILQLSTNGLVSEAAMLGSPTNATLDIIDSDTVNEPPGSVDTTYSPFAGFNGDVYAFTLQPNNQLVVGGQFTMANGVTRNNIARLNSDGSLDADFSLPSDSYGASGSVRALAMQTDGRILVGGNFTNFNSVARSGIARLNSDGTVDSLFNPGSGADNPVYAVAETFVNGTPYVLLGGAFATVNGTTFNGIGRLNSDGTPDTTFNTGGLGANATVYALAVQTDGKIVIGGDFTTFNGAANFSHIARLNPDGSADTNFLVSATGASGSVRAIALQLDGRILIGGLFTNVNGTPLNYIARLNSDGTVDSTFNSGLGANDAVFSIALQSDTRIVLGGEFTTCSGVTRNRITRLNPDGTVDPSINFGTGANDFVSAIAIQEDTIESYPTNVPDEKIIIGGGFTQYNNTTNDYIARIFGGSIGGSGAFQFSSPYYSVNEDGTNVLITVLRTGGTTNTPTGDVIVTAYTSNGTAQAGTNYTAVSTNLDFPLGEVTRSFVVPVMDDGVVTPNLTVNLSITNPTPPAAIGNQPTAVLTIVNDDSTMSFSASTYQAPKNIVSGQAAINVIRNGGTNSTATVNFSTTSSGTATPGTDYTPVNETVVFYPGVTNVVVDVPITNNDIPEGNLTVGLQLTSATGTTLISPTNATLTIIDTVNAPGELSFASPAYSVTEGGPTGYTNVYITIQRTYGSSGQVSVGYSTMDGTAVAGAKYVATNGVVDFADGETSKTIFVPVINTTTAEGPETFSVYLFNPTGSATLVMPTNTVVTILDTNIGVAFSAPTFAFTEPSGVAPGTVTLNVIRFNNTNGTTTVNYTTTNGTAVSGLNFEGVTSGTVTFNPGDTMQPIVLTTLHDTNVTGDLSFTVGLSNPSLGAQLTSPSYAVVTDHDADTEISLYTNQQSILRTAGFAYIVVSNSNPNVEPVSVNYTTSDGTALAGQDYIRQSGTLTFTNGTIYNYFQVPILLNNSILTNRSFTVTLSGATGSGELIGYNTETVTIIGTNTPAGLSFATPIIISGVWGTTNANNTPSSAESGDPEIAGQAANGPIWFEWTAPPGGNGEVTLDTIGSASTNGVKLDTVMGVFTGSSLTSLSQVAANDDLYPNKIATQENEDSSHIFNTNSVPILVGYTYYITNNNSYVLVPIYETNNIGEYTYGLTEYAEPFAGPSGLRFNATAGQTYYIAVDTKSAAAGLGYSISNGVVILNTGERGDLQLSWAYHPAGVFRFATEQVDNTGISDTNGNTMLLYTCAETEGEVPGSTHDIVSPVTVPDYDTTFHAYYYYDVSGLQITVTRVAGSTGRVMVNYSTVDGNTNIINNGDIPAMAYFDYVPVSGTLTFDDFEMSKTIVIPIVDRSSTPLQNRDFTMVLSNPQRDPAESQAVSEPRVDPIFGQVLCRILSCDIDPKGPSTLSTVVTNVSLFGVTNVFTNTVIADQRGNLLEPTNGIFGFSKRNYQVVRDVQTYWNNAPVTVYVNRYGTNNGSYTIHYRFDNDYLDQNDVEDSNNEFPLQAGSDYATPTPASAGDIKGTNSDFAGVGGDSGTLSFPGGKNNPFQSQPIHFNIQNNHLTGFNKDIHISLYEDDSNNNPEPVGMVDEADVTILFDDLAPPAGSVDEFYNPDFATDLAENTNSLALSSSVENPGTDPLGEIYSVVLTTNNQAVIGGGFSSYTDGVTTHKNVNGIARLNADGSMDTNFNMGGSGVTVGAGSYVRYVAISTSASIIAGISTNTIETGYYIAGNFTSYDGIQRNGVAHLNLDGTLDTSFNPGAGANGSVSCVLALSNGQAIIGGNFTTYNGATANYIARLNSNGSLDTTFNPSNLITGPVSALALSPLDGATVMVGGQFGVTGQFFANLVELNPDGTLNTSFNPGTGPNGQVLALGWQTNGQVIVGGSFASLSGVPFNNLVRLNADGSIDTGFNNGIGSDNAVDSLMLDPATGLIYVGGSFTEMNGTHRLGFARLYTDGSVDTSFLDPAYNQFAGLPRILYADSPGTVYASALESDGNVIIGGSFQEVGGGQADYNVRQTLEKEEGLTPGSTNNLLVAEGGAQLQPKTRDGVRNRSNLARLIGGSTTGPGNIGMTSTSYAANESQVSAPVTLTRANGSLGYAMANFMVSPVLAQSGVNYQYDSLEPLYPIGWEYSGPTRMHSDGQFGASGEMQDIYGEIIKYGVDGPASVNVTILSNSGSSGDLNAKFVMSNPSQQDLFYLGGQDIPVGVALGVSQAPFTLINNFHEDGVLSFASPDYVATNSLTSIAVIRTNGTSGNLQVSYQTVTNGSTAIPNVDYLPTNSVVPLAFNSGGATTESFPVTILNNSSVSAQEKTINLQLYNIVDLSGGNAQLGLTNAVLRVINPNFPGYLSFSTNIIYGQLSSGVINVTVTRTVGSEGTLSVQYATADGLGGTGAKNGTNYVGTTNTLTWNNGDVTPRTISIPLINNGSVGNIRFFSISLFNAALNGVSTPSLFGAITNATLIIQDDNSYGTFQFSQSSYQFNANGGYATITVTRTGSASSNAVVGYTTMDGTAVAGTAYVATNNTLKFTQGQEAQSFNVRLLTNYTSGLSPANLYFAVALSNNLPEGEFLGAPTNALVHIVDTGGYNQPPGSPDDSFAASVNGSVLALALQTDGHIIAGGDFTVADSTAINRIARFNTDGSVDGGFMNGLAGADGPVYAVVSQTDNQILVGGAFTNLDGVVCERMARLMTNGLIDTSFIYGAGADNSVFALAETFINGARYIYAGGAFSTFNTVSSPGVVRVNDNGAVDTTFNIGQGANGPVYAMAAYPTNSVYNTGQVLVAGLFTNFNGSPVGNLARLNMNGSLDTNFDQNVLINGAVRAIAIQMDGKIVIGGDFTNVDSIVANHIARLNSDGTVDTAFTTAAGAGIDGSVYSIAVQADNRIMVGGQFGTDNGVTRPNITRLLPTGGIDPTIDFGSGANGAIDAMVIQPADGNIIIGGNFTVYDGQTHDYIARIFGGSETGSGAFQFTSANYQVDENAHFASITIERTGGTSGTNADGSGTVYVEFMTLTNGTAVAGTNYVPTTNYVAFPPGEVLETVSVPVMNDFLTTSNLTVPLLLTNPTPGTVLGNQSAALLTIINDNSEVVFDNAEPTVSKNTLNGVANIQLDRIGSTGGSCTVDFFTGTNGTAVIGTDYYPTNVLVTFNPGDTNEFVQVEVINNGILGEGPTTVSMSLTNAVNTLLASPSNALLTIEDTIIAPGNLFFLATNYNADSSAGVATIWVGRTNGNSGLVTVEYTTVQLTGTGAAVPTQDYTPISGTLQFQDGQSSNSFTVQLNNGSVAQAPVMFGVQVFNPQDGAGLVAPTNATVTIYNTNAAVAFTMATNTAAENQGTASIVVERFNNDNIVSMVNYATVNGTATAGVNYSSTSGTLTFGVGETFKSISVPLINQSNTVPLQFGMNLSSPVSAQLIAPTNTVIILNGSGAGISFSTNLTSVAKNAGFVPITVICSNPSVEPTNGVPLEVSFATVDGTAKAGINYNATNGVLVFTNGIGTNTINIPIFNNPPFGNLTFSVYLTNVTTPGYITPPNLATNEVIITESSPGFSFSQANYNVFKNSGIATITVDRSGDTNSVVAVNFLATNGTAIGYQNFYPTNGTLLFTNGVTTQTFNVALIDDSQTQPNLFALLELSDPTNLTTMTNAELLSPSVATLTILETGGSYVIPAGMLLLTNSSLADLQADVVGSNDTVKAMFAFRDAAGQNVTNLIAYLLATNGVVSPNPASQAYGPLTVYAHSVSEPFSFTAHGTNSYPLTPTFMLYDNGTYIGSAIFTNTLGTWTTTFANTNLILINPNTSVAASGAAATPYPSIIEVSGVGSTLIKATVTLTNLSVQSLGDIDALVVSPSTNVLIMGNVGGSGTIVKHDTYIFDDYPLDVFTLSITNMPQFGVPTNGIYKSTQYGTEPNFP